MSEQSRLNIAVTTPVESLTDEQKQLLVDSRAALSEEEVERFVEAGILEAVEEEAVEEEEEEEEEATPAE